VLGGWAFLSCTSSLDSKETHLWHTSKNTICCKSGFTAICKSIPKLLDRPTEENLSLPQSLHLRDRQVRSYEQTSENRERKARRLPSRTEDTKGPPQETQASPIKTGRSLSSASSGLGENVDEQASPNGDQKRLPSASRGTKSKRPSWDISSP
jgi:hypothetical protein